MKELLFLPLFVLCLSIANAQDSKFEIGYEVGLNFSSYAFSDEDFENNSIIEFLLEQLVRQISQRIGH